MHLTNESDPDPDPTIFVIDLQEAYKKHIFLLLIIFWRYVYIIFSKIKWSVADPDPTIWIRWIRWICMLLSLPDPDPLVRGMDPDPSVVKQNSKENIDSCWFVPLVDFFKMM